MNYEAIYNSLIERGRYRKLAGYTESHHIVPRCMGGKDDRDNLVDLSPEEHYLAHQLLIKIHPNHHGVVKAASMMIPNRPSNKMYGWLRRKLSIVMSELQSGEGNSQYGTTWITNGVDERKFVGDIPLGWRKGRLVGVLHKVKKDKENELKAAAKLAKLETKREELRSLHRLYCEGGFDEVRKSGYKFSKPNLVAAFAKYLPEFAPQNGKKR